MGSSAPTKEPAAKEEPKLRPTKEPTKSASMKEPTQRYTQKTINWTVQNLRWDRNTSYKEDTKERTKVALN